MEPLVDPQKVSDLILLGVLDQVLMLLGACG